MTRVLITGADQLLGKLAREALSNTADLRLTGYEPSSNDGSYVVSDLREPDQAAALCDGIDVILHLAPYHRSTAPNPKAERLVLDQAARGTFVLCHAARKAGVSRIVLASRLEVVSAYPEEYVVDETWAPIPHPDAVSLAPYMAELTLREFVRAEDLIGVCLRLGELGEQGTTPEDTLAAIQAALAMDLTGRGHHWWLFHIDSTGRFPLTAARQPPLSFRAATDAG